MYTVIIPLYRNEEFVPLLISEFSRISEEVRRRFDMAVEFVFVVDASPDRCYELLQDQLPQAPFPSQLILHARNFGSFAAVRTGLIAGRGDYFGVIAADLQEPPELLIRFLESLRDEQNDIVIGVREGRDDPAMSRVMANLFWRVYRRLVIKDLPEGGVDIFGCTRRIRDELIRLEEAHSSLVGLVFWLGFRRKEIGYERRSRAFGKSAWTLKKKINYLLDSVFAFTDLPIRILTGIGFLGLMVAICFGLLVMILRLGGEIRVPGYATTVIVIAFFGALNTLGLGLIGSYAWRTYENTKRRPLATIQRGQSFDGTPPATNLAEAERQPAFLPAQPAA